MEDSEKINAFESLEIITNMINEAKGHLQRNSFYYLLWGWTVMIAQVGMFILYQSEYAHPYLVWLITIPAWIYTMVRAGSRGRHARATTHFDSISGWLWLTYSVTILTLIFFGAKINYQINPLILLVTAIPTVVSGVILKFRPLQIGGVFFWIVSILCFLLPMNYQPLAGAVAIIGGYLIPGYMLKSNKE